jgi:3-hydroxymyristoyl/3-hydroxydecanoyl-(acyl carrier protein) dehydratase
MPSLIGETLGQLAAWNVMEAIDFTKRPVAGVVACATVHRPAYVGETLFLESYIDSLDDVAVQYHSVARVDDDIVFTIDGALGPLLPMDDFIEQDEVRRQFAEINRPGEWPLALLESSERIIPEGLGMKAQYPSFDAILTSEPGIQLSAIKRISRSAPYFADHFPNKPVLPMTLLLECKLNLAREFIKRAQFKQSYQVREMRRIKMNEFVYPGDVVTCQMSVKRQDDDELVLGFRSEVDGKRVCVMELCCIRTL